MRQLIEPAADETLIARGKYVCCREFPEEMRSYLGPERILSETLVDKESGDGRLLVMTGVTEEWTIHQQADGGQIIRCDRESIDADNGMQVQGILWNRPTRQPERMEIKVWVLDTLVAEGVYHFEADQVHISRRILIRRDVYSDLIEETMPLPLGYRADFSRLTISRGFIVRELIDSAVGERNTRDVSPTSIPVFSPSNPGGWGLLFQPQYLLRGQLEHYSVTDFQAEITMPVGNKLILANECDLMMSDSMGGFGYSAFVDKHGVMLRDGVGYYYYLHEYERFDGQ